MIPEAPRASPATVRQSLSPGQRAITASWSTPSTTSSFWRLVAPATMRMARGGDVELVGQQPDQGDVRAAPDGRRADADAEDPIDDAIDAVGRRSWRETDGEADVGGPQDLRRRAIGTKRGSGR